jgi:hypothetical protein
MLHNGVRISESLANKIALNKAGGGDTLLDSNSDSGSSIRAAAALASHVDKDVQEAAEKMISKSKALSKALETSKHVNNLLLAREEEELEKIDKISRQLLENEALKYGLDTEKREEKPCGQEEAEVLRCYLEHTEHPLRCREIVKLYSKCAMGSKR